MLNRPAHHSSRLRQMISAGLAALLLFSNAVGQASSQPQATKDTQGMYRFRVESELVLVNVVVRDKQGKPLTDLKQEDFTVLEDGKPQRISSFDFENLDTAPLPASSTPTQQTANGQPTAPPKAILTTKDADQALSNK
ncbi:MAG TPA: hypothetical protein VFB79_14960, partial [Candidatus Angelobacter sp.]|nr:hypothetical protein [Candidatus Angelobacter sp.]